MTSARPSAGSPAPPHTTDFRHEALLYGGIEDFLDATSAFIREGVETDEPVFVVVNSEKIALLRGRLGSDADRVEFADMSDVGANPARIIPAWHDFVRRNRGSGRRLRGIGEPISNERGSQTLVECQRHESLLNLAFADAPAWWLLCPYDSSVLDAAVIEEALRSHPLYFEAGRHRPSDIFDGLDAIREPFDHPLPEPSERPVELEIAAGRLAVLRRATMRHALANGLSLRRAKDLMVAMNEAAINSLRHGGGRGILRQWRDGDTVVAEISDRGRIADPLVGRSHPTAGQEGGFGMWVVHQLCDLVQVRVRQDGSVVRMHMSLNGRSD